MTQISASPVFLGGTCIVFQSALVHDCMKRHYRLRFFADVRDAMKMALSNSLLSHVPASELDAVRPFLTRRWLPEDAEICRFEQPSDQLYFPESAIVSVIVKGDDGRRCNIGIYGSEGFGNLAAFLDCDSSPPIEVVQAGGYAISIQAKELQRIIDELPELRRMLYRYVRIFMMQVAYTALSNSSNRIEQRLARWLLMFQDRMCGCSLSITHQRLSNLLGVRRPGVTEAIHMLEGRKLIRARRGLVDILDRPRLELLTAGCYGRPEAEYKRLI